MKVVILCGGKGTRLKEKTESIPKPLIEIGNRPILQHIMEIYSFYGFNKFVLCLGYKGSMIADYFKTIEKEKRWTIHYADTGEETNTGGRVKKIEPLITEKSFMLTYGDGLADIRIPELVAFHEKHGKTGTVTAVRPPSQFGLLEISSEGHVNSFREKPKIEDWINGGFFVFRREFFKHIQENDILEKKPLETLSKEKNLLAFKHDSFWKCMDTYKDTITLNELWAAGNSPWSLK